MILLSMGINELYKVIIHVNIITFTLLCLLYLFNKINALQSVSFWGGGTVNCVVQGITDVSPSPPGKCGCTLRFLVHSHCTLCSSSRYLSDPFE